MSEKRFAFGKNWEKFVDKHFSEEKVEVSQRHMLEFMGLSDLQGLTFMDIGCGSGLHSLAAHRSGADKIVAFDYDENSVSTARYLHEYAGKPDNWSICQGSVLDENFINSLEKTDVVYSWGVLHHTGDQWSAIRNAASRIKDRGQFYIALYTSDVFVDPTPEFWLDIKQRYVKGSALEKRKLEAWYIWRFMMGGNVLKAPVLLKAALDRKRPRGMSVYTDIKDWLGGWPMEFSAIEDVKKFADQDLNLELKNIITGEANTEYLFAKRTGAAQAVA